MTANADSQVQSRPTKRKVMEAETKVCVGKIIKLSNQGWGFISSKDIEFTRIFFHWTALQQGTSNFKELKTGMKVEFVPVQLPPPKGWRATKIKVLNGEEK